MFTDEELITYGWPEDVWSVGTNGLESKSRALKLKGLCLFRFHVDKLSSAHVYLRLKKGESWEDIPDALLTDLAQLTKANSIEGNKKNNLTVIYTPWSNLKKTPGMETGQVTFHKNNLVKRIHVKERENAIV